MSERKILLDPGHYEGYNRGVCMAEGTNNWHYGLVLKQELEKAGFTVGLTKSTIDANPALSTRGAMSAGYDAFLSLHSDAGGSASRGVLVLDAIRSPSTALAAKLAVEIAKAMGTSNRGVLYRKNADGWSVTKTPQGGTDYYGVLRASRSKVAMLIEHGFHTNAQDCNAFKTKHRQIAQATARVLVEHFDIRGEDMTKTPIMGKPTTNIAQMQAYARAKGAKQTFIDLAPTFYEVGVRLGVDPAVLYAQSGKETAFMHFGGVLDASFKNPCGLKTTKGGGNYDKNAHQRFASWEQGIIAQADHLALYAGAPGYPKKDTPDPRHFPSITGVAPTVEQLGTNWAPSPSYGTDIVMRMGQLTSTKYEPPKDPPAEKPTPYHIGVYAHNTADLGGVLRIIAQVDGAVLVDASRVNPSYYKEIIQVGGPKDDKATIHLSGANRAETDQAVTAWLQERRQK